MYQPNVRLVLRTSLKLPFCLPKCMHSFNSVPSTSCIVGSWVSLIVRKNLRWKIIRSGYCYGSRNPFSIVTALQLRMRGKVAGETMTLALPDFVACVPEINTRVHCHVMNYTVL